MLRRTFALYVKDNSRALCSEKLSRSRTFQRRRIWKKKLLDATTGLDSSREGEPTLAGGTFLVWEILEPTQMTSANMDIDVCQVILSLLNTWQVILSLLNTDNCQERSSFLTRVNQVLPHGGIEPDPATPKARRLPLHYAGYVLEREQFVHTHRGGHIHNGMRIDYRIMGANLWKKKREAEKGIQ